MKTDQQDNFAHYKTLGLLLTLYFAQGLPSGFVTQALPAILRQYNASLVAIGWSGLVLVPWGIKFLWSPFVDSHYSSRMGRSRSWILPLQIGSIVVLVILAFFEPSNLQDSSSVFKLYALLFVLSLMGATHDVATDGLATRLLKTHLNPKEPLTHEVVVDTDRASNEQHRQSQGNAMQAIGYRMGLIIGGGVLLMMLDTIGWQTSFLAMAGLVALNTLPILRFRELSITVSASQIQPPKTIGLNYQALRDYVERHYAYFWSNKELKAWLMVLLTFKIADGMSSGMVKPMMVDVGIKLENIGFWVTILGSGASLVGAWVATMLLKRLSRYQALLGFNFLQAMTTGLYGLVAWGFYHHQLHDFGWLYAVNALEHFCASLALIAMLTTVMHYARHDKAGSDFTMQLCLLTILGGGSHFISGYLADFLGYTWHFAVCMGVGLICLLPIIYWHKCQKKKKYIKIN